MPAGVYGSGWGGLVPAGVYPLVSAMGELDGGFGGTGGMWCKCHVAEGGVEEEGGGRGFMWLDKVGIPEGGEKCLRITWLG